MKLLVGKAYSCDLISVKDIKGRSSFGPSVCHRVAESGEERCGRMGVLTRNMVFAMSHSGLVTGAEVVELLGLL